MTEVPSAPPQTGWAGAWPDALAFAVGLGLAWFNQWQTTDLVWSLWLSSLVVGYAMIVWSIFGTGISIALKAWGGRALLQNEPKAPIAAVGGVMLVGGLFLLAFFTVHFGGFHFVHSVFLSLFFPIGPGPAKGFPGLAMYVEVCSVTGGSCRWRPLPSVRPSACLPPRQRRIPPSRPGTSRHARPGWAWAATA